MTKPTRALKWIFIFSAVFCLESSVMATLGLSDTKEALLVARAMVGWLEAGNAGRVMEEFTVAAKERLPQESLEAVWRSLNDRLGGFKAISSVSSVLVDEGTQVSLVCEFAKAPVNMKVLFDFERKVSSLQFSLGSEEPAGAQAAGKQAGQLETSIATKQWAIREPEPVSQPKPAEEKQAPAPVVAPVSQQSREEEVVVGQEPWQLPGTLTLPAGDGLFPAVILVHGSGPHDRDETVGANKPFRDLAQGLSSRGIAVLRYEKRTKAHRLEMVKVKDELTVKEEVIDDVLAALNVLRQSKKINPAKIFVLGHSMGGWLLPRIAKADTAIAGGIILAGNTRSIEELIVEQMQYIASLDGVVTAQEQEGIDKMKVELAKVSDPNLSAKSPAESLPFGVAAAYWLDLRGYDPAALAATLTLPLLILQGERDYQVTMIDFAGWKQALRSRSNVTLKSYPGLNHLFISGKGKSVPSEYANPGHMSAEVVKDIADWILR